jgi:ubiquinone/menaquinone biosynthesis C-methylase UbiE
MMRRASGRSKPNRLLEECARFIPKGNVLDLSIGEGRNAFFAKMSYEAERIDISNNAIKQCIERAKNANPKVKVAVGDLKEVSISEGKLSDYCNMDVKLL